MLPTRHYVSDDPEVVKRLIRENPWATFVSPTRGGLVASHYPVLLDEQADGIQILSHLGRPDDEQHELGEHELLVIIQGPHGYVSPGWYPPGDIVPTWNHVTAHLYGRPELLPADENFATLDRLVRHFEARMPEPRSLGDDEGLARRIARGTVGIRMRVRRFEARLKLSQNRPPEVAARIIEELEHGSAYPNPRLAREMRTVHGDAAS